MQSARSLPLKATQGSVPAPGRLELVELLVGGALLPPELLSASPC
jgi:hypothetical protein